MRNVIIGNGGAALESIVALRSGGYESEIHLYSDSVFPAYNPTLLTYFIAGKIGLDAVFPYGEEFYKGYGVKLHMGSKVVELDANNRTIENDAGIKLDYDSCIVCTGASPDVPGLYNDKGVFTIRSVENAIALKKRIIPGEKALVVGASLIGVKVVEALVEQGMEVSLTDTQEHVFPLAAHANCASLIEAKLEEKGVALLLGSSNVDISVYDLIVVCTGVKPNISFINNAQVKTDKGILVDAFMRTSADGLYAAGDCAQMRDGSAMASGLWAGARYMGRVAGYNIAGKKEACCEVISQNITRFLGIDFVSIGDIHAGDDVFEMEHDGKYCRVSWENGRIAGINLLNMPEVSGIMKSQIRKTSEFSSVTMGKVFNRYPAVKEAFLERGA